MCRSISWPLACVVSSVKTYFSEVQQTLLFFPGALDNGCVAFLQSRNLCTRFTELPKDVFFWLGRPHKREVKEWNALFVGVPVESDSCRRTLAFFMWPPVHHVTSICVTRKHLQLISRLWIDHSLLFRSKVEGGLRRQKPLYCNATFSKAWNRLC